MRGHKLRSEEEKAAEELRKLKKLLDNGLITQQQYEERKSPFLAILIVGDENKGDKEVQQVEGNAAQKRADAVERNLPQYADHDDFDLSGVEKAIRHEFDPRAGKWTRTAFLCRIEEQPFAEGAMRTAHRMWDLATSGVAGLFVVKFSKDRSESSQQFFEDVQMQMEARMWAQKFNERNPPKSVDFIAAYVLELVDRPGHPFCGVENFISGTYRKWNNNWDWNDDERNTPQAFSHFTWEASGNKLLVCDLQGVGDLWTDPQIHTCDRKGYGKGNLGMEGIKRFLGAHKCNNICSFYRLPRIGAGGKVRSSTSGKGTVVGRQVPNTNSANAPVTTKGLVGVGLALANRPGEGIVVTQVLPHGPAFKDGRIMAGDVLRTVEGKPVGRVIDDFKGLILGKPGTSVRLGFSRGESLIEVTLVRMLSDLPQSKLRDSQRREQLSRRFSAKSLLTQVASMVLGSKAQALSGGKKTTSKDVDKHSGYDDPDLYRGPGWNDPDILPNGRGGRGQKLASMTDWVLIEEEEVKGNVSPAKSKKRIETLNRAWSISYLTQEEVAQVLLVLFQYLHANFGSAFISRMSMVNKTWKRVAHDDKLWSVVRCGDECCLDNDVLNSICARAQGHLEILDIATSPQCASSLRGQLKLHAILENIQMNPTLREIHLSGCVLYNELDLAELGLVVQDLQDLMSLSLEACNLQDSSLKKLIAMFACSPKLEMLSLAYNEKLGIDGISILCAALRVNKTITSLDLRGCSLQRQSAEELAQILLTSQSLTDLQIDQDEECAEALKEEVNRHALSLFPPSSEMEDGMDPAPHGGRQEMLRGNQELQLDTVVEEACTQDKVADAPAVIPRFLHSRGFQTDLSFKQTAASIPGQISRILAESQTFLDELKEALALAKSENSRLREEVDQFSRDQSEWEVASKEMIENVKSSMQGSIVDLENRLRVANESEAKAHLEVDALKTKVGDLEKKIHTHRVDEELLRSELRRHESVAHQLQAFQKQIETLESELETTRKKASRADSLHTDTTSKSSSKEQGESVVDTEGSEIGTDVESEDSNVLEGKGRRSNDESIVPPERAEEANNVQHVQSKNILDDALQLTANLFQNPQSSKGGGDVFGALSQLFSGTHSSAEQPKVSTNSSGNSAEAKKVKTLGKDVIESIRALIATDRTDMQIIKHYTLIDYDLSVEDVQRVRASMHVTAA
eukprot:749180-Hanusia_phi.AAC.6